MAWCLVKHRDSFTFTLSILAYRKVKVKMSLCFFKLIPKPLRRMGEECMVSCILGLGTRWR
jgi:hypothetical protein